MAVDLHNLLLDRGWHRKNKPNIYYCNYARIDVSNNAMLPVSYIKARGRYIHIDKVHRYIFNEPPRYIRGHSMAGWVSELESFVPVYVPEPYMIKSEGCIIINSGGRVYCQIRHVFNYIRILGMAYINQNGKVIDYQPDANNDEKIWFKLIGKVSSKHSDASPTILYRKSQYYYLNSSGTYVAHIPTNFYNILSTIDEEMIRKVINEWCTS